MRKAHVLSLALILVLPACAPKEPPREQLLSPEEKLESEVLSFRELAYEEDAAEVRRAGRRILDEYPGSPYDSEIRLETARAALELGMLAEAESTAAPLLERKDEPQTRFESLMILSGVEEARGRFMESASHLIEAMSIDPGSGAADRARETLAGIVPLLSRRQLERLREDYPASPGIDLVLEGSIVMAEAAGDTAAVRRLMERIASLDTIQTFETRPGAGLMRPAEVSEAVTGRVGAGGSIGLLCPLSGRFAALGREFLRGAAIALKEARRYGTDDVELVVGDTRSRALDARETALRLIEEESVSALAGGVLSSTTIAAAQTAQERRTVLYSPVASEQGIDQIGEYIFQSAPGYEEEIIALVKVARDMMGLSRMAFMGPDTDGSRRLARLYMLEVERSGGVFTGAEFYEPGSTDFGKAIRALRKIDAEALFIPSDTDDLVLILPQLSFYEYGVQLLGTSAWNSNNLLRMAGRDMEGAVFPAEQDPEMAEGLYAAAAALLGEEETDVNRFVTGGYSAVRRLIEAMRAADESGSSLREALDEMTGERRHRYIEAVAGEGMSVLTVRKERVEEYARIGPMAR